MSNTTSNVERLNAERLFGFKTKTRFEEGLRRTIEWYEQVFVGVGSQREAI